MRFARARPGVRGDRLPLDRRARRKGYRGDFAITGEPTDLHVGVQAKGVLAGRLEVRGKAAHGSTPWLGDNAVLKAVDVFRRIESLPFSRESSELFDRPSINLGRITGGDALNKVPDLCTMDLDIRYLPGQDPGDILEQIRAIGDVEVERTFARRPAYVSRANPYVVALGAAVRRPTRASRWASAATAPPTRSRSSRPAARGRVRPGGRRSPRARGVGVDLVARALPPGAVRLRPGAAGRAGRARARPARRRRRARRDVRGAARGRGAAAPGRGRDLAGAARRRRHLLATAGAVSAAVLLQVDEVLDVLRAQGRAAIEIPEIDRAEAGKAQTLMILGSDIRYADREAGLPPRSDTIMLVRLDPDKEVIAMTSIPRDLLVTSPASATRRRSTRPTRRAASGWRSRR